MKTRNNMTPHTPSLHHSATPSLQPAPTETSKSPSSRRRFSKIARLPPADRDLLNVMLHDGAPYTLIASRLADHPASYTRLLNALCKLTEAGLKCERHRRDEAARLPRHALAATRPSHQPAADSASGCCNQS
jgi:hypothetical protein